MESTTPPKQESFKIYFGTDDKDIRRVTLRSERFEEVVKQLYSLYNKNNLYHPELRVQYEDEEGDKITVSTQHEWEEMWSTVGSKRPIKIFIAEGPNPSLYFKDGPQPEVVTVFKQTQEEQEKESKETLKLGEDLSVDKIVANVPESLQKLFPGGKILPYHLPEWLKDSGALTVIRPANAQPGEVDLDVNVDRLVIALDGEALRNIGPEKSKEDLEKAKLYLETLLLIQPVNSRALYNLACVESILGNIDSAVQYLEKAVEQGYKNVDHMEKDQDLDNVRGDNRYAQVVKKLKGDDMAVEEKESIEDENQQPVATEVVSLAPEPVKVEEEKVEQAVPAQLEPAKLETALVKVEQVEKQKEEPIVEEKKKESKPVETRFVEQLKTLEGMGYDASLCAYLLDEFRGDITKVLEYLFEHAK